MSRGSKLPAIVVSIAAVLLLVLIGAAVASMEEATRVVRIPPTGEARENPVLAAERFLNLMGAQTSSVARLDAPPGTDHVLILESRIMTQLRSEQLLEWVDAGGYLIVAPDPGDDPLLDGLGVSSEESFDESEELPGFVEIGGMVTDETMQVRFESRIGLLDAEDEDDLNAYSMFIRDSEEGSAVVLADMNFLLNENIGDLDHAAFLWDLVSYGGEGRPVILVHNIGSDSIWGLLIVHAWPVMLLAAILLATWLWRSGVRFGPRIPEPAPGNRALMEHVDALGHFLWRSRRADALVESAREALHRQIRVRRPGFAALPRASQVDALAVGSDLPQERIDQAVFGTDPESRDGFVRMMNTLEHLRREL